MKHRLRDDFKTYNVELLCEQIKYGGVQILTKTWPRAFSTCTQICLGSTLSVYPRCSSL